MWFRLDRVVTINQSINQSIGRGGTGGGVGQAGHGGVGFGEAGEKDRKMCRLRRKDGITKIHQSSNQSINQPVNQTN